MKFMNFNFGNKLHISVYLAKNSKIMIIKYVRLSVIIGALCSPVYL